MENLRFLCKNLPRIQLNETCHLIVKVSCMPTIFDYISIFLGYVFSYGSKVKINMMDLKKIENIELFYWREEEGSQMICFLTSNIVILYHIYISYLRLGKKSINIYCC